MAYYVISSFGRGIDRRRLIDTGEPGSLWDAENVWINEGGQIEKRLAWTEVPYITTALRHDPSRTIIFRGISPEQIVFASGVSRTALNAAGKWPHDDATVETPYTDFGSLEMFWLRAVYAGGAVPSDPWYTMSAAFLGTEVEGVGFLGFNDQGLPRFHDMAFDYAVSPAGVAAPGSTLGAWSGDATVLPQRNPRFKMAHKTKMFEVDGQTLSSGNIVSTASGAGSAALLNQEGFMGVPMALASYYDEMVVFGQYGAQFWRMAAAWADSAHIRSLDNMPLISPRSVVNYGGGDVLFLAADGVRSLSARDSSNFAKVSDIGAPIDDLVRGADANDARHAISIVHTRYGHYWIFLEGYCYVFSRYPSARVQGWTRFALPAADGGGTTDFTAHPHGTYDFAASPNAIGGYAADACPAGLDVALRTFEDRFYVYGGADGRTYDASEAIVTLPFMDMGRPGTSKSFKGVDVACEGTWTVEAAYEPYSPTWETIATITNSSFTSAHIHFQALSTHLSLRLRTTTAARARVGQIVVHYELGDQG